MLNLSSIEPVDYLVVGHITRDITPNGPKLGGTAAFSALTALSAGLRVGVVTAAEPDYQPVELNSVRVLTHPSDETTTFENIATTNGRIQLLHAQASELNLSMIPETWRKAPIVHLGPVAQEVDPKLARSFPDSLVGLTLQGWLRGWDEHGRVHFSEWPEASFVLPYASAAVLSIEDVRGNEQILEDLLSSIRILVVTEASAGARLYWNGDVRYFRPPDVVEVDPTGAGDIFATCFFIRLQQTRDPWEAARFATQLSALSVTRLGLSSVPTSQEFQQHLIEVLP